MALLKSNRGSQWSLTAEFQFNFNDTMVDVTGATKDFGLTNIAATTFEISNLPPGSVVVGGEFVTETAFDTASYAVVVGDSAVPDRYLATGDRKGVARVALIPTGFRNVDGLNVRVGITNADVCTTGKATLRVEYIVAGRTTEVQTS